MSGPDGGAVVVGGGGEGVVVLGGGVGLGVEVAGGVVFDDTVLIGACCPKRLISMHPLWGGFSVSGLAPYFKDVVSVSPKRSNIS